MPQHTSDTSSLLHSDHTNNNTSSDDNVLVVIGPSGETALALKSEATSPNRSAVAVAPPPIASVSVKQEFHQKRPVAGSGGGNKLSTTVHRTPTTALATTVKQEAADREAAADRAAALAASIKKLNRFSDLEKALLYSQFREHQQIIDIKQRRSSYSSHKQAEVRACWDRIVVEYNAHPDTQNRTLRQIQKFWLNSKLRNQIPSDNANIVIKPSPPKPPSAAKVTRATGQQQHQQHQQHQQQHSSNNSTQSQQQQQTTTTTTIVKRTIKNDGTIVPTTITTYTIQPLQIDGILSVKDVDTQSAPDAGADAVDAQMQHLHRHSVSSSRRSAASSAHEIMQDEEMLLDDDEVAECADEDDGQQVEQEEDAEEQPDDQQQVDEQEEQEHQHEQHHHHQHHMQQHQHQLVDAEMLAAESEDGVEDMIELKFIDAQSHAQLQDQQQQQEVQDQQQLQQQQTHQVRTVQVHENGGGQLQLLTHGVGGGGNGTVDRAEFANIEQIEMITADNQHYTTTATSVVAAAVKGSQRRLFCGGGSDCGTPLSAGGELIEHSHHSHHGHHQQQHQHHQQQQTHLQLQQHSTDAGSGGGSGLAEEQPDGAGSVGGVVLHTSDEPGHHHHHHHQNQHHQQQQQQQHQTQQQLHHQTQHNQHSAASSSLVYADQLNELRVQEAQCRLRESELRCELQQLAVQKANEELRQMRELHVMHINEMQLKLDKMKKELRLQMT